MITEMNVYASLFTDTPADAELFAAWLDEREADREILEMASGDEAVIVDSRVLANACSGYSPDIAPRQIRILSKRYVTDPQVVPFVAVIEKWDDDMWLIAPFSQYATPATPGEMDSGTGLMGRQVIQAWNARTIQERLLSKSFLCGELDPGITMEVAALFRNQLAGTELPETFSARRGPAIAFEADPRRDYVMETIRRFQPLSTAVKATERALADREHAIQKVLLSRPFGKGATASLAYAAGTERSVTEKYKVGESELWLTYDPEQDVVLMSFYDAEGEPTREYDGYAVMGQGIDFVGTFMDGSLSVPADAVSKNFTLTNPDGCPVEVCKVEVG